MNKDVEIGQINELKFYLAWDYVKDICNKAITEENQQLKELLDSSLDTNKALAHRLNLCKELLLSSRGFVDKERITLETSGFGHNEYCRRTKELLTAIDNAIGEK